MTESQGQSTDKNSLLNNWRNRLDELIAVKSVDDLKSELVKLGGEIHSEIQKFDIHEHLSPQAKEKIKNLESAYTDVLKSLHRVQKQVDREFNKTLRVLKKTRKDAEKHISGMRKKVGTHKTKLEKVTRKMAGGLKKKRTKKAKVVRRTKKTK
jgi:ABC-type dipeptide/oligopeptide/nickel transport system ATPase subunit